MIKADIENYSDFIDFARNCNCGNVYPLSIALNNQSGDIYALSKEYKTVLFWHCCGFAHISGEYNEDFLALVYDMIIDKDRKNDRRFILFSDNEQIKKFLAYKDNIEIEKRYFYEYKECDEADILPQGCELKVIDSKLLSEIKGRITPYFAWENGEEFLQKGKGYCMVTDGEVSAWAFSSAVSDEEIDIGVETAEKYQHRGYARIVSRAMVKYILSQNKTPVWACHYKNTISAKLAEKIGFYKVAECYVIKRKEN